MSTSKKVSSGDSAIVFQAEGSINLGLQYSEVRQLFDELFELNFDRLVAAGRDEANRRRTEVAEAFIDFLSGVSPEEASRLGSPEMQRAIVHAQVEHATTGDPNDATTYANLLIEKLKHPGKNLPAIACQKAIETVSSLTQEHIDALTCIFIVFNVKLIGIASLEQLRTELSRMLEPYVYAFTNDLSFLRHLDSAGCIALDPTRSFNLVAVWRAYPGVGNASFTEDDIPPVLLSILRSYLSGISGFPGRFQLLSNSPDVSSLASDLIRDDEAPLSEELLDSINRCRVVPNEEMLGAVAGDSPVLARVVDVTTGPGERLASSCFLTNVGFAIAHSNLRKSYPSIDKLDIWVH